jgi:hypothetical protein
MLAWTFEYERMHVYFDVTDEIISCITPRRNLKKP